jgi:hypothetical protein
MLAPVGTPKPITDPISREVVKIVQEGDVKEKFATLGFEPVGNMPTFPNCNPSSAPFRSS